MLRIFVIGLLAPVLLMSCADMRVAGSATSNARCAELGGVLPTRSRADTQETVDEITQLYATFAAVCPDHAHLIP